MQEYEDSRKTLVNLLNADRFFMAATYLLQAVTSLYCLCQIWLTDYDMGLVFTAIYSLSAGVKVALAFLLLNSALWFQNYFVRMNLLKIMIILSLINLVRDEVYLLLRGGSFLTDKYLFLFIGLLFLISYFHRYYVLKHVKEVVLSETRGAAAPEGEKKNGS